MARDVQIAITETLTPDEQRALTDHINTIRRHYASVIVKLTAYCVPTIILHGNGLLENRWPPHVQKQIDHINECCEQSVKALVANHA